MATFRVRTTQESCCRGHERAGLCLNLLCPLLQAVTNETRETAPPLIALGSLVA